MSDDLMRRMRDHVGYDPAQVLANPEGYSRAERRAAARVLAKSGTDRTKPVGTIVPDVPDWIAEMRPDRTIGTEETR